MTHPLPFSPALASYDLANGDADGLCALHQLRMLEPCDSVLLTGVKRDIRLFQKLPADIALNVTALDVSFDHNEPEVHQVLQSGGKVRYFDHHTAQKLFSHPRLECHIDTAPDMCTSILVDRYLGGMFRHWTIVAAYGDNLPLLADRLADASGCKEEARAALAQLGCLLNYNAYGETPEDLHFHPAQLYQSLHRFESPLDFVAKAHEYQCLVEGYAADRQRLSDLQPLACSAMAAVYVLPGQAWARRLSGTLANHLAAHANGKSLAVLTPRANGNYVISVRMSAASMARADTFCSRFPGGGGRHGAGGIDNLPEAELGRFITQFFQYVDGEAP